MSSYWVYPTFSKPIIDVMNKRKIMKQKEKKQILTEISTL